MNLIRCKDLVLSYEGVVAARGINCDIASGDYLCVIGHNGSGKTTFIRGLLGLLKPAGGQIEFSNDLAHRDIGYLPQQSSAQKTFPASVREVVISGRIARLGLNIFYNRQDRSAVRLALQKAGIADLENHSFAELSGGQQQRVLLARALCATSDGLKVMILDEPMNSLDAQAKVDLYQTIEDLNKEQGIAIVMITHDVQSAVQHASHILVLEGEQAFFGTTHAFEHTAIGVSMLRDSCGHNCSICGLSLEEQ